jgi:hypothetical protein
MRTSESGVILAVVILLSLLCWTLWSVMRKRSQPKKELGLRTREEDESR